MDKIIESIANVGFPIAVATYLLIRIEAKLDNLTISIEKLAKILEE